MFRFSKRHLFTLTEVMIATVVLGLAVAATAAIVSGAQTTVIKAENRWARQHLASNAAEFYLKPARMDNRRRTSCRKASPHPASYWKSTTSMKTRWRPSTDGSSANT